MTLSTELDYDPFAGPEPITWRRATAAERTAAIQRWLRDSGLPPNKTGRESVERWRRVEEALSASEPHFLAEVIGRLLESGVDRTIAVWATSELVPIDDRDGQGVPADAVDALLDPASIRILPAAFEALQVGLSPAHLDVISHYHERFDPDGSMSVATAAGFCFGCAASPKFVRNHVLHRHFFGGEPHRDTPTWLPAVHAYEELFRFVSDAVFEQDSPMVPGAEPPEEAMACFDATFSHWCRGFLQAGAVVEESWISHLEQQPGLWAEYTDTVDTLSFFAGRSHAQSLIESGSGNDAHLEEAARKRRARLEAAATRLFVLAQPVLRQGEAD